MEKETTEELKQLKEELAELNETLEDNKQRLEDYDDEEAYDEMLDDCHEALFNILPSTILRECDPIAYRCGLADFEDEGRSELENDIKSEEEQIKDLEAEIEELEEDL